MPTGDRTWHFSVALPKMRTQYTYSLTFSSYHLMRHFSQTFHKLRRLGLGLQDTLSFLPNMLSPRLLAFSHHFCWENSPPPWRKEWDWTGGTGTQTLSSPLPSPTLRKFLCLLPPPSLLPCLPLPSWLGTFPTYSTYNKTRQGLGGRRRALDFYHYSTFPMQTDTPAASYHRPGKKDTCTPFPAHLFFFPRQCITPPGLPHTYLCLCPNILTKHYHTTVNFPICYYFTGWLALPALPLPPATKLLPCFMTTLPLPGTSLLDTTILCWRV